jgi:hypothetical protein
MSPDTPNIITPNVITHNCYLYSMRSGALVIYCGSVFTSIWSDMASFRSDFSSTCCAKEPGKVQNQTVWFSTRDDKLAKELLIKHEELHIDILRDKIEDRHGRIKAIREGKEVIFGEETENNSR